MNWRYLLWGTAILVAGNMVIFKIQHIQRLKVDIAKQEAQLQEGQAIWTSHPPLTLDQRENFKRSEKQLSHMLPKEKDMPSLLEEISRLARERNLMDLSFQTDPGAVPGGGAPPAAGAAVPVVVSPAPVAPAQPEAIKPIDSFSIKVTFMGDYQEIAYFLTELERLPRLVKIQSVKVNRGVPLLPTEVLLQAYYKNDGASMAGK